MPYNVTRHITAGPVVLPGVTGSVGAVYSEHRADKPSWGAAVELPAVLELLAAIETADHHGAGPGSLLPLPRPSRRVRLGDGQPGRPFREQLKGSAGGAAQATL